MGRKGGSYSFEKRQKELAKKKKKAEKIAKRHAKDGVDNDDDIAPIDPAELGLVPDETATESSDDDEEDDTQGAVSNG